MATRIKLIDTGISPTLAGASFTGDVNFEGGQLQYDASSNSLDFQDNIYAQFGTSDDLRIYHDGSNSYIWENGTGNLILRATDFRLQDSSGNSMAVANSGGGVGIYHNASQKLETTSAGATVTGTLTVTGDLDITGNVNSASVTDLDVTDKTITLGVGQTEAQSGGSGIVIDGSGASMLWDETNGEFDFNNPLAINNSIGGDTVLNLTGTYGSGNNVALLGFARSGGAVSGDIRYVDSTTDMEIGTGTAHAFSLKTGGTRRMYISNGGIIGIGAGTTGYGGARMQICGDDTSPDLTSTAIDDCTLILSNSDDDYGTVFATTGSGVGFIQQRRMAAATYYHLLIQPYGGRLGVATDAPNATLHVGDSNATGSASNPAIQIGGSTTYRLGMYTSAEGAVIENKNGDDGLQFRVKTAGDAMRIKANGFVGIGTTSPLDLLHIKSTSTDARLVMDGATDAEVKFAEAGTVKFTIGNDAATDSFVIGTINVDTDKRLVINSGGNVGINDASPDRKVSIIGDSTSNGQYPLSLDATNTDYTLEFRKNGSSEWWIAQSGSAFRIHENGVGDHVRINAGGKVGIGVNPSAQLDVDSGATSDIVKFQNNNGSFVFGKTAGLGSLDMAADADFRVRHGSTVSGKFTPEGFLVPEGQLDSMKTVPFFSGANAGSYSTSTNVAYTKTSTDRAVTYDSLKAVLRARAYTKYVHVKTNITANNVMFYFRVEGYAYNYGMNKAVRGGYTYNGAVITQNAQQPYRANSSFRIGNFYLSSTGGFLCMRIDVEQTGYTEGELGIFFGSHSQATTRQCQITDMQHRNDGTNAY